MVKFTYELSHKKISNFVLKLKCSKEMDIINDVLCDSTFSPQNLCISLLKHFSYNIAMACSVAPPLHELPVREEPERTSFMVIRPGPSRGPRSEKPDNKDKLSE